MDAAEVESAQPRLEFSFRINRGQMRRKVCVEIISKLYPVTNLL